MKDFFTWVYGIAGMIIFFLVLFYAGNIITFLINLWYVWIFLMLPIVFVAWLASRK